ncbi:MAG: hypothetical protein ACOCVJ_03150 [Verrucomicrobiota bacterium]
MKPKKVIFWIIFGVLAYSMFGYVQMHTRGDVIAYKRFAKAIMKNDDYTVGQMVLEKKLAREVLASGEERMELFDGAEIVFTFYDIDERRLSEDGKTAFISAEQVSRVNPEGFDTIWGEREVRIRQTVRLVLENQAWRIASFNDPAMGP